MQDGTFPSAHLDAALTLSDGKVFFGKSIGAATKTFGEVVFNTAITGYQEILTDPSYAGQIITFTFPHIGNTGVNPEDIEADRPVAAGLVVRADITGPSNWRSIQHFDAWLKKYGIAGICGIDTRALTRHIRERGAQNGMIVSGQRSVVSGQLKEELERYPSMTGKELAKEVSCKKPYEWNASLWRTDRRPLTTNHLNIIAIDYGIKQNILRSLVSAGCNVTVVPADMPAKEILQHKPDGIFLSNGPGDPAATAKYAIPIIKELIQSGVPIFGICMGHQLLALALGCETEKMRQGHHGANHPVKDLETGKVEITSQNHGFVVKKSPLPSDIEITHISLFDNSVQGIKSKTRPLFSVQGHPEASPGPHDSLYLFERFVEMMEKRVQGLKLGVQCAG